MMSGGGSSVSDKNTGDKVPTIVTDKKDLSLTSRFIDNRFGAGLISVFGTAAVFTVSLIPEKHRESLQRLFGTLDMD